MRSFVRRLLAAGLLAGLAYAVLRAARAIRGDREPGATWESQPFPFPPVPHDPASDGGHHVHIPDVVLAGGGPETEVGATEEPWIEPVNGTCPPSHPVKAKLSSGIFHVEGGASYERTKPDRCYCDEDAAAADGLRRSKV